MTGLILTGWTRNCTISGKYGPVDIYQCKTTMQSFVLTNQFKCNYLFVISHYVCCIQCNSLERLTSPKCEIYNTIISSHCWMFSSWYECIFSCFFPTYFKFLILYYVRPILSLFKRRKRHFLEFIFQDPELCFTIASIQVDINPSFDSLFLKCCLIIMFHY